MKKKENISTAKKIIAIESQKERYDTIEKFISIMESDCEINVFFGREDEVIINTTSKAFKLDDMEIYHIFFEQLKRIKERYPDYDDEIIPFIAIKNTLLTYFEGKEGNRAKRNRLTSIVTEDDVAAPSISTQKGQNCSTRLCRRYTG